MIRIESLSKSFKGQMLFENLNLEIPDNKTTLLSGPSGCGKTTLLRIIAGLDKDYTGTVSGVPGRILFMFQEDRLLPWMSLKENIEFVLKDVIKKEQIDEVVNEMIDKVRLSGHENKPPSKLSGGMNRRVALTRAFCYPADLYLLDEPFKGFDVKLQNEMLALFKKLFFNKKKTVLIVTHDQDVIQKLGQNVIDIEAFCLSNK